LGRGGGRDRAVNFGRQGEINRASKKLKRGTWILKGEIKRKGGIQGRKKWDEPPKRTKQRTKKDK